MNVLPSGRTGKLALSLAVIAAGAVLLWISIGVTITTAAGRHSAETALRWWPWGAIPKAELAWRIASDLETDADALNRAERMSREAYARGRSNVVAVRNLAMIADRRGEAKQAERLFAFSERLSRRDLTTQLWLIEKKVRDDDIPGALRHYDRAMRTSRVAPDMLLPILISAMDDPTIARPLEEMLAQRPPWWRTFFENATASASDPRILVRFADRLGLHLAVADNVPLIRRLVDRLVKDGHYGTALAYYDRAMPSPGNRGLVRDGEFDREPVLPPFDWWVRNDPDLSAAREMFGPDDMRLALHASSGNGGEVARQMLVLRPGRYALTMRVGNTGSAELGRPSVKITCSDKRDIANMRLPAASDEATGRLREVFTVPANCPALMLSIRTAPAFETDAWIDGVAITPAGD